MFDTFKRIVSFQDDTFGTLDRREGIIKHLEKELSEVRENPDDTEEWIDLIFLAFHGYCHALRARLGYSLRSVTIVHWFSDDLLAKLEKNLSRDWPDMKNDPTSAVEHKR